MIDIESLKSNQVFIGVVSAGAVGAVGFWGKSALKWCADKLKRSFSFSVTLNSRDAEIFPEVCRYILSLPTFAAVRSLYIEDETRWNLPGENSKASMFLPAPGFYWGRDGLRLMFLDVNQKDNEQGGVTTTIKVGALAVGESFLKNKIKKIAETKGGDNSIKIRIGNDLVLRREKRPLESVYLENGLKEEIVNKIEYFFENRERYRKRGIPYCLKFLFTGKPGTGKSSLIFALASYFNMEMRIVPAGMKEEAFSYFISQSPPRSILVVEDIDVADISVSRENKGKVNLATLLNTLDGVRAPESCVIILTTNKFNELDPALVRPGRIDKICHFDYFSLDFARKVADDLGVEVNENEAIIPAELVNL